ncbi:hypothetical protein L915_07795 [Plasmopara halstedii]|uniref:Uncharacterized protein n=1 Tax=Plasmopara halstedii TaxID=4781 RepID=A0A0P1AUP7_PLAHL|nr:hypothetical protein L915_07795 [Plasmopara halstedii]CEG45362.1 hypothetical protein L915_07795 [Plasmopara halstedii]|eukprot:XP_024581731.1 hypothetical protein L915_07795 [Plasmopara halstedii]
MTPQLAVSVATTLRRRQGTKLMEKFNLATLNGGKSPFDVSSNRLLKVHKKPPQSISDKFSLDYLLGTNKAQTKEKVSSCHAVSSNLM